MAYNFETIGNMAAGGLFGLALEGHNDERQLRQAAALQDIQIQGQKDMTRYNWQKQLEMWNATNYEAQMKHIKAAGLNPALLYGKSGAGGTTGSASGSVTGQSAPTGGREVMELTQMALQKSMMEAQIKLAEAQANKTNVEATKIGGVDTQQTIAQTDLLAQELDNKREDYQIKRLQQAMMNIENWEKQQTQADRLEQIHTATKQAMRQLQLTTNTLDISDATVQDQIKLIQLHAIGASIQNEATQAGIKLTAEQIKKVAQEIVASKAQVSFQELETIFRTNFPSLGQTAGRIFNDAIEAIYKLTEGQRTPHNQPKR